jgi:hypothetical protein
LQESDKDIPFTTADSNNNEDQIGSEQDDIKELKEEE